MEIVLGILFGVAAIAAVLFGLQAAQARAQASQARGEMDGVRTRLAAIEGDTKKATEALDAKRRETEELKEKLKDVKKRRHEDAQSARLKQDIQHAREEIEREMEKKLQVAREEAEISKSQVKKLSEEVANLKSRKPERAPEAPKPVEPAKPVEPPRPLEPRFATPDEVKRAEESEKAAALARRKVDEIQEEIKKVRARAETDRRVFLVQKSEVELAKDRFRAMEAKANSLVLERDEAKKAAWLLEKELKSVKPTSDEPKPAKKEAVAKPAPVVAEAAKPVVDAPKPVVAAAKPAVEAPKPAVEVAKPAVEAPKPVVEAVKPAAVEAPKAEEKPAEAKA